MTSDGSLGNYLRGVSIVNDHALSSVFLDGLQRATFDYFVHEANRLNGLIADKTQADGRRASHVRPALMHFETLKLRQNNAYGFKATFNAYG